MEGTDVVSKFVDIPMGRETGAILRGGDFDALALILLLAFRALLEHFLS